MLLLYENDRVSYWALHFSGERGYARAIWGRVTERLLSVLKMCPKNRDVCGSKTEPRPSFQFAGTFNKNESLIGDCRKNFANKSRIK